jgi:hypothetical protein
MLSPFRDRRGASIQFATRHYDDEGGIRRVFRATLEHVALTDGPAFKRSWIAPAEPGWNIEARLRATELRRELNEIGSLDDESSTSGCAGQRGARVLRSAGGLRLPQVLTGYAAKFNSRSLPLGESGFREEIDPRAFDQTIEQEPDVRFTLNHDPSRIFGRTRSKTLRLWRDAVGLAFEVRLPSGGSGLPRHAASLAAAVGRGDISNCSFSFRTIKDEWRRDSDGTTVRRLLQLEINNCDVSAVTFPAFPSTEIQVGSA